MDEKEKEKEIDEMLAEFKEDMHERSRKAWEKIASENNAKLCTSRDCLYTLLEEVRKEIRSINRKFQVLEGKWQYSVDQKFKEILNDESIKNITDYELWRYFSFDWFLVRVDEILSNTNE